MCNQYLFFFDPGTDVDEDRLPIATGTTREEATNKGIPRLLQVAAQHGFWGLMNSSGMCVAQPQLCAEEFKKLDETIEAVFAKEIA